MDPPTLVPLKNARNALLRQTAVIALFVFVLLPHFYTRFNIELSTFDASKNFLFTVTEQTAVSANDKNDTIVSTLASRDQQTSAAAAAAAGEPAPDSCEGGRRIYVHPLPTNFRYNAHCEMYRGEECKGSTQQRGFLKASPSVGNVRSIIYDTDQFDLFSVFDHRFRTHPCRVDSVNDADLVWVPFGLGDMCMFSWKKRPNAYVFTEETVSNFLEAIHQSLRTGIPLPDPSEESGAAVGRINFTRFSKSLSEEWLPMARDRNNSLAWNKCQGCQYLILDKRVGKDCDIFLRGKNISSSTGIFKNTTLLSIEASASPYGFQGVPYPGHIHPANSAEMNAWGDRILRSKKNVTLSLVVGYRRKRAEIIEDCRRNPDCSYVDAKLLNREKSLLKLTQFLEEAEFCLQPEGDTWSRQSFFDSIAFGCMPVLISEYALCMYQQTYLSLQDVNLTRFVLVAPTVNAAVDQIKTMNSHEISSMRDYMVKDVIPRVLYMSQSNDSPAELDAFEATLEVIRRNVPLSRPPQ